MRLQRHKNICLETHLRYVKLWSNEYTGIDRVPS
jgi:hypothetical protein